MNRGKMLSKKTPISFLSSSDLLTSLLVTRQKSILLWWTNTMQTHKRLNKLFVLMHIITIFAVNIKITIYGFTNKNHSDVVR